LQRPWASTSTPCPRVSIAWASRALDAQAAGPRPRWRLGRRVIGCDGQVVRPWSLSTRSSVCACARWSGAALRVDQPSETGPKGPVGDRISPSPERATPRQVGGTRN
jgi:hypothetical protein